MTRFTITSLIFAFVALFALFALFGIIFTFARCTARHTLTPFFVKSFKYVFFNKAKNNTIYKFILGT